jgi:hypothetical protein
MKFLLCDDLMFCASVLPPCKKQQDRLLFTSLSVIYKTSVPNKAIVSAPKSKGNILIVGKKVDPRDSGRKTIFVFVSTACFFSHSTAYKCQARQAKTR